MDLARRALTRMCEDETKQFLNVLEWARKNPTKDATVYAINRDEKERLQALLASLCSEGKVPSNIYVTVQPDDYRTPVHVRTQ